MSANRSQGRPPKGETQVGRDHLVEVAQRLLLSGDGKFIGRAELAEAAKVTPSLVNYYFRDQGSLIEAVTAPVIGRSIAELKRILRERSNPEAQLKALIRLFLSFNRDYAVYLDGFLSVCAGDKTKEMYQSAVIEAYDDLVGFFQTGMHDRHFKASNPAFLVFALWGICKFIAQNPMLPVTMLRGTFNKEEVLEQQVTLIFGLLSQGVLAGTGPHLLSG